MFRWLGKNNGEVALLLSVPHSGENIPDEATWLRGHTEAVLLTDVDRFVDELYRPAVERLGLPLLATQVHRYAADLNRYPDDVDADSVVGAKEPSGAYPKGFHWVMTTMGHKLMPQPIARATHEQIVRKYHDAFHALFEARVAELQATHPGQPIYHLDCHSMPSTGTGAHADAGAKRPDVVISDFEGKSCEPRFKDLVLAAFKARALNVSYNWPYKGGRITQRYGQPAQGHHTVQIELNRALYMDENTRLQKPAEFSELSNKLCDALADILSGLKNTKGA